MTRVAQVAPARGGGSLMVAWRLEGRRVLVVGGGTVAAGRVTAALDADAHVRVVAPRLNAELRHRWRQGTLDWRPALWSSADLDDADMVLACLDDEDVSTQIAAEARARGIPVNCADHVELCDFWFASVHREGPLQIALSTNGQGPALGARLRDEVAAALPNGVATALDAFGRLRRAVREAAPEPAASPRRMGWLSTLARSWSWSALAALDDDGIATLRDRFADGGPPPDDPRGGPRREGPRLRLVGAGPGAPDLLTVRARQALAEADLVLADRLVPPAILALVQGELRIARKWPGRADAAQDELHAWALEGLTAGRDVVRLKCGDPFVFGRGGEEVAFFAERGIATEIVPGLSSAFAAPVDAGIPTTMRGVADRVLVLTAHGQHGRRPVTPAFDTGTTYVWLMGVGRLEDLVDGLRSEGFPAHWPVAIVERATHADARTTRGTLADIAATARDAGVRAPAAIVVGRVVEATAALPARLAAVG